MYAANPKGQRLTFEVYGVWRKNMVMNDRQTGTIWQHATGTALDGVLKDTQLEVLPGWETTWGELRSNYPQARYAVEPEKFTGLMPKAMLQRALHITHVASVPGLSMLDKRLDSHEMVIGLALNGEAKAYPLASLRKVRNIQDQVGGETLRIEYIPAGDRVVIHTSKGKAVQYERQWWLGWQEFHPRCAIFRINEHEHA